VNKEKAEFVTNDNIVKLSTDIPTDEQSWKSLAYIGAATAIGSALLFGLVYMRR
jgi:hypothetical protein